jgi:chromosome segregation ATPase
VLYLAEVQKQKGGILGGGNKAELKLLACQRNDQSWSGVSDESVTPDDASKLNDGALILVELTPQRQVQRIQEAGRPLVTILQNFSRQLEKLKSKEEEIDQWKESLTYQGQELSRRELEMEDHIAQLEQMEQELKGAEADKQEAEKIRAETESLKEEIERSRQELEGAWEHLRGEQRRLDERQAEGGALDAEQGQVLGELLQQLASHVPVAESVQEHLNSAVAAVESQQTLLNPLWEQFQQHQQEVESKEQEVERLTQEFTVTQDEWEQVKVTLEQQSAELKANAIALDTKLDCVRILNQQLQSQEQLYQQVYSLAATTGEGLDNGGDLASLESLSLEQLEQVVQELQEKLEIDSSFVNDQEQELDYKQVAIAELQQKISQAGDVEKISLEEELIDEKDLYQMLNETLVGQRRSLSQRQQKLQQHQNVLLQRQGKSVVSTETEISVDLKPILTQIENFKQQYSEQLAILEREIEQIRTSLDLANEILTEQTQEHETKRQSLKALDENLCLLRTGAAESRAKLSLYQEILQPVQDTLDDVRQKVQGTADSLGQVQQSSEQQLQVISQIQEAFNQLTVSS